VMMLPAITSRFWARDVTGMIAAAVTSALVASYVGLILSFRAELPSGPAIVLVAGFIYLLSLAFGPVGGLIWLGLPRRHLEA